MSIDNFATFTPVPLKHLQSGTQTAHDTGFVAFGLRKWDLFRQIDRMRAASPVPVLFLPSREDIPAKASFVVSWKSWFVGSEKTSKACMTSHSPTTGPYEGNNHDHWAVFWHAQGLVKLPQAQHLPISAIKTIKGVWRKEAPPRGPELVATPSTKEFQL